MKYIFAILPLIIAAILGATLCPAQDAKQESKTELWQIQDSGCKASLRGLCVVSEKIAWASGSDGTVLRTVDGGKNWQDCSPKAAKKLDFRDIHAFNDKRAVIVNAGQPARFYLTTDGGKSWKKTFEHPNEKSFFDAVSFWDDKHGIAMSDPIDDRVLLIETLDGGTTWKELPAERRPKKQRGEAGFAASGTNMRVIGKDTVMIALGGAEKEQEEESSRIVISRDRAKTWTAHTVPMPRNESSGIFSIEFTDAKHGIAVGGDYLKQKIVRGNMAVTNNGGRTWTKTKGKPTTGYRSCVVSGKSKVGKPIMIAVGPTGTDVSIDGGKTFANVSSDGFHAVQFTPDGKQAWASGPDGKIALWVGY